MNGNFTGLDGGQYRSVGEVNAANTRYKQQERLIKAQEEQNRLLQRQIEDEKYKTNNFNTYRTYNNSNIELSSDGLLFTILGLGNSKCGLFISIIEFIMMIFILPITRQVLNLDLGCLNLYAQQTEPTNVIVAFGIVYIVALSLYTLIHMND